MKNKLGTNLRKRVVMVAIAGAMALTGVAGMTGTAKAEDPETYPNYLDTDYSFKSVSSVGYTECRKKTDTTKVYIHPTSGPNLYYRVQGTDNKYVREDGKIYARVKMRRSGYAADYTRGVWSPDSSRNYDIFD